MESLKIKKNIFAFVIELLFPHITKDLRHPNRELKKIEILFMIDQP